MSPGHVYLETLSDVKCTGLAMCWCTTISHRVQDSLLVLGKVSSDCFWALLLFLPLCHLLPQLLRRCLVLSTTRPFGELGGGAGDAPADGIAGWEAVQYSVYQVNRSELVSCWFCSLWTPEGAAAHRRAKPHFDSWSPSTFILQEMWLCVCRPPSSMKALGLALLFASLLDSQLFNRFAFWDRKEPCYFPLTPCFSHDIDKDSWTALMSGDMNNEHPSAPSLLIHDAIFCFVCSRSSPAEGILGTSTAYDSRWSTLPC